MRNRPSKGREQQGPGIETTPHYPEGTPPLTPSPDYAYVLETVMTMRHALGKLEEAVGTLKSTQSEQGTKLDGIDKKVYAAIAVIIVFGSILTFFANSINTALTSRMVAPTSQQQANPAPFPSPSQSPTPKFR